MKFFKGAEFHIASIDEGMLQHNKRLANPRDEYVIKIKEITKKKKKTEQDYEDLIKLEWYGGLYSENERVIVPAEWIERMFVAAARKTREGKNYEAALFCNENPRLIYNGPEKIDELWESGQFTDIRSVVVNRQRIMRTRPIFRGWSLIFKVDFIPAHIDFKHICDTLETAGMFIGLSTYRPRFGKFEVKKSTLI
jgi:hypothetical protein